MQGLAQLIFGAESKQVSHLALGSFKMGSFEIHKGTVITLVVGGAIMVGLTLFVKKTKTGRAMLAMKNSTSAAQAMGISLMKYRLLAFVIATVFAAIGGWILLGQTLSAREMFGCALMLTASVIALLPAKKSPEK